MTTSEVLLIAGAALILAGMAVPGWDTARMNRRAVKRRIYWAGTGAGIVVLFASGLPDLQSSLAVAAAGTVMTLGWAYFRTPNIVIGGRIRSADPAMRDLDV
ncbi:MAG: hypothetical protein AB1925_08570 [Actinomycetota bacterium]